MSGLDMRAYHSEEDPYLSGSYSRHKSYRGGETLDAAETEGHERRGPKDPKHARPEDDAYGAEVDGWEILGRNAQKSVPHDGLGGYDPTDVQGKVGRYGLKPQPNDTVKAKELSATKRLSADKTWEIVPLEPDWDMVNRKETREARRATKLDTPLAEDWVVYNRRKDSEVNTFEGQISKPEDSTASTPQSESGEQEPQRQPQAVLTMPAEPQPVAISRQDHHSSCSLDGRPSSPASKHNPFKQRPLSAEEKDLPFIPVPTHSRASTMQSSVGLEYPEIIRKPRTAFIIDPESPGQAAAAATREAARRTDERFARLPDWHGLGFGVNYHRYR
jgi:hypothetical protein